MKLTGTVESLWRYPVKSMRGEDVAGDTSGPTGGAVDESGTDAYLIGKIHYDKSLRIVFDLQGRRRTRMWRSGHAI
jgi:hypothetical protein